MARPPTGDDPQKVLTYLAARLAGDDQQALAEVIDLDEYRRARSRNQPVLATVSEIDPGFDDDLDPVC
ncbi:MAG: hypothetical protein V3V01_17480 [Acidimicrobiales bacterium]